MAEFLYNTFPNINWGNLHFVSTADLVVRGIIFPLLAVVVTVVLVKTIKDIKEDTASDIEWEYEQEDNNG